MAQNRNISDGDIRNMILKQGGVDRCVLCGKCASVCPSFREFKKEVFSPRGRTALAKAFLEEKLIPGERYLETLSCCLFCRACEKACPTHVRPGWINQLLKNLPEFEKLHENILPVLQMDQNNPYPESLFRRLGWKISPISFEERFRESAQELKTGGKLAEVVYFPGCIHNHVFPEAARSTMSLLEKLGYRIMIPEGLRCCGAPYIYAGDLKTARNLIEKNLRVFEKCQDKTILCDCAGCASTIRFWSDLFPEGSEEKNLAENMAGNAYIFSDFLKKFSPSIFSHIPDLNALKWAEEIPCNGWALWLCSECPDMLDSILKRIDKYVAEKKLENLITEDAACYAFLKKNLSSVKIISLSELLENNL
ncbi:(Fe-S)-binding protein [Candidatus Sumerlaeota bacterium]|nr:(Fe-S)-binding protein [Candidatus Sumerlaeota bacterium]